ncbi:MAG: hypothetical protein Q4D57_06530 [Clostridia bacterium]|nr:hypothetical protein [Clostridia bacterium]
MVSPHNGRRTIINTKYLFKKIALYISLLTLLGSINTKAFVFPECISTYAPRELPKFSSEIVTESYIVSRNLKRCEYNTFLNLVKLRNYLAKCQNLLKNFYEENFYLCDFLVINGGTLDSFTSRKTFSMVSWLEPTLTKNLPHYIDTLDKIDILFIKNNYKKIIPLHIELEEKNKKFSDFFFNLMKEHLVSRKLGDEDIFILHGLIENDIQKLIMNLKDFNNEVKK